TVYPGVSSAFAECERNPWPAHGEPPQHAPLPEINGRRARASCRRNVCGFLPRVHRELCSVKKGFGRTDKRNRAINFFTRISQIFTDSIRVNPCNLCRNAAVNVN